MRKIATLILACLTALSLADGYKRQPEIDILNYDFAIAVADDKDEIKCAATITLQVKQGGLKEFWLDLKSVEGDKGMTVEAVTSPQGIPIYYHSDNKLHIEFSRTPMTNEILKFEITYSGVPTGGLWIGNNKHGERGFFSLNWPNRTREWLPMIDHPSDKATHEFRVTAPAHYLVVAGGLLQSTFDHFDNTRTTHWKQSVPIASWLVSLSVSRFAVKYFDDFNGIQHSTWVFPQDREKGVITFEDHAKRAIRFFSETVGPYSYEKLAHIQAAGFGGGTELASAILYGQDMVRNRPEKMVVVHETAHQWWGNAVTENDWNDIWLSEGFATYFTLLYDEHTEGRESFVQGLKAARNSVYRMEGENPDRPIRHANLQDMKFVTSGIQYQKGAWFLHMLRVKIGTSKFWEGIRAYYAKYRDKNATTEKFRAEMEAVYGNDLEDFFDLWLTRGVSPTIEVEWSYDAETKAVNLRVEQKQNQLYPVTVYIVARDEDGKAIGVHLTLHERVTTVNYGIISDPVSIEVDPNTELLISATVTKKK